MCIYILSYVQHLYILLILFCYKRYYVLLTLKYSVTEDESLLLNKFDIYSRFTATQTHRCFLYT